MEKPAVSKRFTFLVARLLIVFGLLGPASSLFSLEAKLSLDNDRYVVGQKFSLDILLNAADPLKVKLTPMTYPPALALVDGPFIRETTWDEPSGKVSKGTKVTLSFRVLQGGLTNLGPFGITYGSQSVVVPSRTLYLLAADEAKKRFPLELRWIVPNGPFYLGQDIPLILQVRNLDSLLKPQDVEIEAPANSLWEKAVGLGEIEIFSAGEDRIMNIPWGAWMLIPTQTGTVQIPPVTISVGDLQRKTPPLELTILPLPADVLTTRAVGDLTYNVTAEEGKNGLEGQVVVVQEVRGRGNFPYLVLPEVKIPGMRLISRQEGSNYRPTGTGYQGSLSVTWRFAAEKAGKVQVTFPGFVSYQPDLSKTWAWDKKNVELNLSVVQTSIRKDTLSQGPLSWDQVVQVRSWGILSNPWYLLLFLPGAIFFGATFRKNKSGPTLLALIPLTLLLIMATDDAPKGFDEALRAYKNRDFAQSQVMWERLIVENPNEPGLWYNKALTALKNSQEVVAITALRKADLLGFQGSMALDALREIEEAEHLTDQFRPWTGPSGDLLLVILMVTVNLSFVFGGLLKLRKNAFWLLPTTIAVLCSLLCGAFLYRAVETRGQIDAVVGLSDGPIRKVPGELAESWMTIKKGTVVRYLGQSGDFVLIQTGFGLEGWMRKSNLIPFEAN